MDKRVCTTNPDGSETWLTVCQAEDRIEELQAELAALKAAAEAMEEFIDSCTYHMRGGNTVNYDGPRAEEGGE